MQDRSQQKQFNGPRLNHQIRVPQVRVVEDGTNLGLFQTADALRLAQEKGLDLVEIVPNARPPVCAVVDYGKYKYDLKIKEKEENQKRRSNKEKVIQLRYCTGDHDLETKTKALKEFLEEKRQVRIIVRFRPRELAYRSHAEVLIRRMEKAVAEVGKLEVPPRMDGKTMIAKFVPAK